MTSYHTKNYMISDLPLNGHDDLALGLVRLHELMRLNNLLPVHNLLNIRFECAILELGQCVLDKLIPQLTLILLIPRTQSRALDSHPLEQRSKPAQEWRRSITTSV